jgi:phage shock protein E
MMLAIGIGVTLILAGVAYGWWWFKTKCVTSEQAKKLVADGATLLDVRSEKEFAGGALPGAVNIPVQQLESRLPTVGAKDKPIVVYCLGGVRSAKAVKMLRQRGFSKVHDLGAMTRWGGGADA